jgi:4-alpha-glucanotransferase
MKVLTKLLFIFLLMSLLFSYEEREEELKRLSLPKKVTAKAWERIGIHDHYGIDVPLLSLRGASDSGCGEFDDLFSLIDWMQTLNLDMLQLLPLNDTGATVSPYSPISFYALHPIYLSLNRLPFLSQISSELKALLESLHLLNETKEVDYEQVLEKKLAFLKGYINQFKGALLKRQFYKTFMERETYWITDYALYKTLSHRFGPEWKKWPKNLQYPDKNRRDLLKKAYHKEMVFYQIVQSLCYEQLETIHRYANEHQVFLIGDFTFLIGINSADVWIHPNLFKLDKSVGVPIKADVPHGQYWGLPPYDWKQIKQSKSPIFLERVKNFSKLYDLYRLDNCLGYFSQFEIPLNGSTTEGVFVPSDPKEAFQNGKDLLLSFIQEAPSFLPYAEAFAMDQEMLAFLEEAGICKLRTVIGHNNLYPLEELLFDGKKEPLLEVFMLSNHDNPTLQRWWSENPKPAKIMAHHYQWTYTKTLKQAEQFELIRLIYNARPIFHINMLYDLIPPHLCLPPQDQGIHVPGGFSLPHWTYRFKLSVEQIVSNKEIRFLANPQEKAFK